MDNEFKMVFNNSLLTEFNSIHIYLDRIHETNNTPIVGQKHPLRSNICIHTMYYILCDTQCIRHAHITSSTSYI